MVIVSSSKMSIVCDYVNKFTSLILLKLVNQRYLASKLQKFQILYALVTNPGIQLDYFTKIQMARVKFP